MLDGGFAGLEGSLPGDDRRALTWRRNNKYLLGID